MARPALCIVTAATMSLEAFWPPLLRRAQRDFEITIVATGADAALAERMGIAARAVDISMARRPSPLADLRSLRALGSLMRTERFDIVHSQTPKAGLLAMRAARGARVPVRLHTFTGQVWATRRGPWRSLLKSMDCHTARCATALLADSKSQVQFLEREGVAPSSRVTVLGHGSVCGVNAQRFRPDAESRRALRSAHGADDGDTVILFVGRLTAEKGVPELLEAFARLKPSRPRLRLWLVGPEEGMAGALAKLPREIASSVSALGATSEPQRFMAAADLLALPSHREGFGSVLIEAAACGIPATASRIYGVVDAVVDGVTGLLHEPHDVNTLTSTLTRLVDDPALRARMGEAARARAQADFDPARIADALIDLYGRELARSRESLRNSERGVR